MSTETPKGIWIIAEETPEGGNIGSKGIEDIGADYDRYEYNERQPDASKSRTRVSAKDLKANLTEFLAVVEEAFDRAEASRSKKMQLDELKLSVEINGQGEVSLLGTGGKIGGKGAIELKFKRKEP